MPREKGVHEAAQGDEVGSQRPQAAVRVPGRADAGLEVGEEGEGVPGAAGDCVDGEGRLGVVALAAGCEAEVGFVAEGGEGEVVA